MTQRRLHLLDDADEQWFPAVEQALDEPNGLLALGGTLSVTRLKAAYSRGIFPWFEDGQPPLWWAPNPRSVLLPQHLRIPRSLRKRIRNSGFRVTLDQRFRDVIQACAGPRRGSHGTWITAEMREAYITLHAHGLAHSVEVWRDDDVVGGLYGVAMGAAFFGESMFSHCPDASKIALVHLVRQLQDWNYALVDCQVSNPHMQSLGSTDIPRREFMTRLATALNTTPRNNVSGAWTLQHDFDPLSPRTGEQP